jgi:GT2 family glycosyltransferase
MTTGNKGIANIGVVTIGRNEGQRLKNCITSLLPHSLPIVYVDSASTDDSVEYCRDHDVSVVELDMSIPFTAARARNEGCQRLLEISPEVEFVQFIDGDCQLSADWLSNALTFLTDNKQYAAVCGRRREIYPLATIYNQLCDIEWDTPVGEAKACGGDVLMRVTAYQQAGGYRSDLIAGEEPDLCFRMRQLGWKIYRLEAEMTLHDANMTRFSQWWTRAQRAGYAYTNSAWLHRGSAERYNIKPVARILFWALILPLLIVLGSFYSIYFLGLLMMYPLQYLKLLKSGPGDDEVNRLWAKFIIVGKFAELTGVVKCAMDLASARKSAIIEYK